MKIENPKLILAEINARIERAKRAMELYENSKDQDPYYWQYLQTWNELFSLRKALFSQAEIDKFEDEKNEAIAEQKVSEEIKKHEQTLE